MKSISLLTTCLLFSFSLLLGQAPANDDLCNATPITIGADCMGTPNIVPEFATAQVNEPIITCASGGSDTMVYNSVWFSFIAPAGEVYILAAPEDATISNSYEMNIYTLGGDCADLSNLELISCTAPAQNLFAAPAVKTTFTEGIIYYIRISGKTALPFSPTFINSGCLTISEISPPTNDNVCDAIDLAVNADAQVFSNIGATSELGEFPLSPAPSLSGPLAVENDGWAPATNFIDNSVWFTFTTSAEGGNYSVDLFGTTNLAGGFNTQVAVYEATDCADFTSFSMVAAGDNAFLPGSPVNAHTKLDLFCLPANTTYYVVVDGGTSFLFMPVPNQGYFSIQVTAPDPIPLEVTNFIHAPDCVGGSDGTVFTAATGGAGEYVYEWSNGDSIPELRNALEAGTYTLTITDRCLESIVDTIVIPESSAEAIVAITGDDESACLGEEVVLNVNATGGILFDTKRVFAQKPISFGTYALLATELQTPESQDTISSTQSIQFRELEFVGDDLYGTVSGQDLYQVNTTTGELTLIDSIPVISVMDLSYVPSTDKLYCTTSDGEIFELDPTTAAVTFVATITGIDNGIGAAAIDDSGAMYASSFSGELFSVNVTTGVATLVGPFPVGASLGLRSMEIDPTDGKLYIAVSVSFIPGTTSPWQQTREISKTTAENLGSFNDFSSASTASAFAIKERTVSPYQYDWTPATGLDDATISNPTFTVNETTTLTATVTDFCGDNNTTTVVGSLLPDASTTIDTTIFEGEMYDGIVYTADAVLMETFMAANGCDSLVTVNITVNTVGTNERWADEAIQISPNPVNSNLIVRTEGIVETEAVIYVRDMYGRVLLEESLVSAITQLNVLSLPNGYYVLEIRSVDKYGVKRFLKI